MFSVDHERRDKEADQKRWIVRDQILKREQRQHALMGILEHTAVASALRTMLTEQRDAPPPPAASSNFRT